MKRIICIVMLAVMLPVIALADDLTAMSYDDLISLSRQLTAEIMSRPEWKEVKVQSGIYEIGTDIPEGSYSIECDNKNHSIIEIKKPGKGNPVFYKLISSGESIGKVTLEAGNTIDIKGDVIFRPPVILGF